MNTLFKPRKKRHLTLTGDTQSTVLAEIINKHAGNPALKVLAKAKGAITDEFTFPRLLTSIDESLKGEMSVALPLDCFDIITIPLPVMPDEAIGKALPYHLSKAIDKPLSEYNYDWQVTQRLKDRLQITAYLLPVKIFEHMQKEFARRQISISFLEADIFAAFAYLYSTKRLSDLDATLCVIIWPQHISLAVYEKNTIILARSVTANQPESQFQGISYSSDTDKNFKEANSLDLEPEMIVQLQDKTTEDEQAGTIPFDDSDDAGDSILEDFALLSKKKTDKQPSKQQVQEITPPADVEDVIETVSEESSWEEYLQHINLEIMRTRDFHNTVLKGGPIKNVYISGASVFWDDLRLLTRSALGVDMEPLEQPPLNPGISSTFNAICLGTGTR